jgi:hypothetical protein
MSETGFRVGAPSIIIYFENETDATAKMNAIGSTYYDYIITTVNDISSWIILTNTGGTDPTPNGGPYNAGDTLIATGVYYLYPYIALTTTTTRSFSMKSLFTNNAQVYYKPHSLSAGGGGSGVKNYRLKQRRT